MVDAQIGDDERDNNRDRVVTNICADGSVGIQAGSVSGTVIVNGKVIKR